MTVNIGNHFLFVFVVVNLQILILLVFGMTLKKFFPVIRKAWSSLSLKTLDVKKIVLLITLVLLALDMGVIIGIYLFDIEYQLASRIISKLF